MPAAFKTEKQFQEWLDKNPSAAARMKPALATSEGVQVTVRMPAKRPPAPRASFVDTAHRWAAWMFLGVVGISSLGIVIAVSALLALKYVR